MRILGSPAGQVAVGLNGPLDDFGRVTLAGDRDRADDQPGEHDDHPSCVRF